MSAQTGGQRKRKRSIHSDCPPQMGRKLAGGTMPNCPRYNRSLRAIVPPASREPVPIDRRYTQRYIIFIITRVRERKRDTLMRSLRVKGRALIPPRPIRGTDCSKDVRQHLSFCLTRCHAIFNESFFRPRCIKCIVQYNIL